jgi:hypothetical protein
MAQEPSIGRIVHYRVSANDASLLAIRRGAGEPGNTHVEGEIVPLLIIRPWHQPGLYEPGVSVLNGKIFFDGSESWALSIKEGNEPGQWSWPVISR